MSVVAKVSETQKIAPKDIKAGVFDLAAKKIDDVTLSGSVFGLELREDILQRVVRWQLAKRRSGNHQTRTISMVQGSTRKPFRQKGTGRARQGTVRAPQHRGGAVVFGPVTRDHGHDLPKKVRRLGLAVALSEKLRQKKLKIVDSLALKDCKTKTLQDVLSAHKIKSALFVGGNAMQQNFARASSNLFDLEVLPVEGLNVYSILKRDEIIITKEAVDLITARILNAK
ncbi:MAG: 50S ribosomal protein L4 [Alphaproteobacteria bacterium]|nr:MAG: 50S ribosomal protein L4 [Alphaproteobacteria bacterium]